MLTRISQAPAACWRNLDPKLSYTLLSAAFSYAMLKGGLELDGDTAALVTLALSGAVGYRVPNDATVVRGEHEDGNAVLPGAGAV